MYRLIVIDKSKANTGGVIENLGMVDFSLKETRQQVKEPRVLHWLSLGATPSETAKSLLKKTGTWAKAVEARKVHAAKAAPKAKKK